MFRVSKGMVDRYVFIDGDGDGFPDGYFMFWIRMEERGFVWGWMFD